MSNSGVLPRLPAVPGIRSQLAMHERQLRDDFFLDAPSVDQSTSVTHSCKQLPPPPKVKSRRKLVVPQNAVDFFPDIPSQLLAVHECLDARVVIERQFTQRRVRPNVSLHPGAALNRGDRNQVAAPRIFLDTSGLELAGQQNRNYCARHASTKPRHRGLQHDHHDEHKVRYGGRLLGGASEDSQSMSAALVASALMAGTTSVLFGLNNGASSGALENLIDLGGLAQANHPGPFLQGWIVASAWAGSVLGALGCSLVATSRVALVLAAALNAVGGCVTAFAPTLQILIAGRVICGFGNGLCNVALAQYSAELAPASVRGGTIALQETTFLMGALTGALAARRWLRTSGGWRRMWGLTCPVGLLALPLLLRLPETPRVIFRRAAASARRDDPFLQGGSGGTGTDENHWQASFSAARAEASEVLCYVRGLERPDRAMIEELDAIEMSYTRSEGESEVNEDVPFNNWGPREVPFAQIVGLPLRRQLLMAGSLVASGPALSGSVSIEGYGTQIFHAIGFKTSTSASLTVAFYAIRLVTTLPDFLWLDAFKRRSLLAAGFAAMSCSYAVASLALVKKKRKIVVAALLGNAVAYQAAIAPMGWIMPAEMYPADMRTGAASLSSVAYTGSAQVVLQLQPLLARGGPLAVLVAYGTTSAIAVVLNYAVLPETQGRSLEEIEQELFERRSWRRSVLGLPAQQQGENGYQHHLLQERIGLVDSDAPQY